MEFVLIWVIILVIFFLCLRIERQDKVVRDLNDRLMAKDFADYAAIKMARDAPTEDIHMRKPISWYDDGCIPDVGDKT